MPLLLIQSKESVKLLVATTLTWRGLFSSWLIAPKDHDTPGQESRGRWLKGAKESLQIPHALPMAPLSCLC